MKFGKLIDESNATFPLPLEDSSNSQFLQTLPNLTPQPISLGFATWGQGDWTKSFYPKGRKASDRLDHYSKQFASIELNATHYWADKYKVFDNQLNQVKEWIAKTPSTFAFCPKIYDSISHKNFSQFNPDPILTKQFLQLLNAFDDRLGLPFLQMEENFQEGKALQKYLVQYFSNQPIAIEIRNPLFYSNNMLHPRWASFLRKNSFPAVITDTPAFRNLVHLTLTSPQTFIRFNSCNDSIKNEKRLLEWAKQIQKWYLQGIKIYFFIHHPGSEELTQKALFFAQHLKTLGVEVQIPEIQSEAQITLF